MSLNVQTMKRKHFKNIGILDVMPRFETLVLQKKI